jgi:hypothetical protein
MVGYIYIYFFFFLVVLQFELWIPHLLGKHSTTLDMPSVLSTLYFREGFTFLPKASLGP